MHFKKIFLISLFLILVMLIGTVSAEDNSTDSFNDLADKINKTEDTLVLDKNYTQSGDEDEILIYNKSVTVDGRGHTLNGKNKTNILLIYESEVTLKNINFINGFFDGDEYGGGAVCAISSNLTIINCTFSNCTSNNNGAAVCALGNTNIVNSSFKNNMAEAHAAVYIVGNTTITNSYFADNLAKFGGGLLVVGLTTIVNSTFKNNTQKSSDYWDKSPNDFVIVGNASIINSTFNLNSQVSGNLTSLGNHPIVTMASFDDLADEIKKTDYLVLDKDYIYGYKDIYGGFDVNEGIVDIIIYGFGVGDISSRYGNGILINKSITIDGKGHYLDARFRSRIFNIVSGNVTFKNIRFVRGSSVNASAVYGNCLAVNCTFESNYCQNPIVSITSSTSGCVNVDIYKLITTRGGAMYGGLAINSTFINNRAGLGGAIYNGDAINCTFINNTADENIRFGQVYYLSEHVCFGGAMYNGRAYNSTFINNYAYNGGGACYNVCAFNCTFIKNSAYNGGAIYENRESLISNSVFKNNTAGLGSDIYSEVNSIKIINSTYTSLYIAPVLNKTDLSKITDNNDLTLFFKSTKLFTVKVWGADGNVASGETVTFTVNGKVFHIKSDENGVASLSIILKPAKYSIISTWGNITVKNTITVKSRLITKNLVKKTKKSAIFKVKVLNADGKVFAKQKVKIKFKGKTYKIKSNGKGIASLKITKKLKAGKYTIKTTYLGLTNTNKVIVKK